MTPLIQLEKAVFGTNTQSLTPPITLSLNEGDKLLLDGPSGSGKTSALRGVLGFLTLRSGAYQVNGHAANPRGLMELRLRTSYVSQELEVGRGPVHIWLRQHLPGHSLHESDLMPYGLPGTVMQRSLEELSRGERQRLTLLLAETRPADLLLLDEVTSALNAELRRQTIRRLAESKRTILAISHDDEWRTSSSFKSHLLEAR